MKIVTLPLRISYVNQLAGIVYLTKTIPAFEEFVQETTTKKKAILTIGNVEVEAYIILLNQTVNDDSPKCHKNDQTTIQVQVTTVFPLDKGGTKTAEEIADLALAKLFPTNDLKTGLVMPGSFNLWKSVLEGTRNISYNTETSTVWITQLILNHSVSQN